MATSVLIFVFPPSSDAIVSGGMSAFTAALSKIEIEKYFTIYFVLPKISDHNDLTGDFCSDGEGVSATSKSLNRLIVSKPPTIASIKAVRVLAMAISMLICVAVRKKIVGFINGEERTNAMTALNGMPVFIRDSPIGIAAYVGKGETKPIRAAEIIAMYSFVEEN
jgi:hypothetical protein